MQQRSVIRSILATLCILATSVPTARAGVFEDVGRGLGLAGFDVVGQRNILSDGIELSVSRNLQGNPLDFGIGELTLRGPISFELNTGQRVMNTLDLNFQTALRRDQASTPLTYDFVVDVGGQQTSVSGELFVDAGLSINEFGFYDLQLQYSSRQDIVRDGRFASEDSQMDFDAGPISVRGNIFADILAAITAPIFDATGGTNIFESFSGSAQLSKALEESSQDFADHLASGLETGDTTLASAALDSTLTAQSELIGQLDPIGGLATSRSVIPEPTVLLLMLAGIPAMLRRRRTPRIS